MRGFGGGFFILLWFCWSASSFATSNRCSLPLINEHEINTAEILKEIQAGAIGKIDIRKISIRKNIVIIKAKIPPKLQNSKTFDQWRVDLEKKFNIAILFQSPGVWDSISRLLTASGHKENILRSTSAVFPHLKGVKPKLPTRLVDVKRWDSRRIDLRELPCFTIDPAGSLDVDDALSIEELPNGNQWLGVHVADVAALVDEESNIDRSARRKAFTIYGDVRQIPMLPLNVSIDEASLLPKVDRLAWSTFAEINPAGEIVRTEIFRSVIQSKKKYDYEKADAVLAGKPDVFSKQLKMLSNLTGFLHKKRIEQGSLDFEKHAASHRIIEECMLLGNKLIAQFLQDRKIPFLYRVNAGLKNAEAVAELKSRLQKLGVASEEMDLSDPVQLRQSLTKLQENDDEETLASFLSFYIGKASYDTENIGHFRLGFNAYTHATSPIRRYADITVQRQLAAAVYGEKPLNETQLKAIQTHLNKRQSFVNESGTVLNALETMYNLLSKVGMPFFARLTRSSGKGIRFFIPALDMYGIVEGISNTALNKIHAGDPNHQIILKLTGFDLSKSKPVFELVSE